MTMTSSSQSAASAGLLSNLAPQDTEPTVEERILNRALHPSTFHTGATSFKEFASTPAHELARQEVFAGLRALADLAKNQCQPSRPHLAADLLVLAQDLSHVSAPRTDAEWRSRSEAFGAGKHMAFALVRLCTSGTEQGRTEAMNALEQHLSANGGQWRLMTLGRALAAGQRQVDPTQAKADIDAATDALRTWASTLDAATRQGYAPALCAHALADHFGLTQRDTVPDTDFNVAQLPEDQLTRAYSLAVRATCKDGQAPGVWSLAAMTGLHADRAAQRPVPKPRTLLPTGRREAGAATAPTVTPAPAASAAAKATATSTTTTTSSPAARTASTPAVTARTARLRAATAELLPIGTGAQDAINALQALAKQHGCTPREAELLAAWQTRAKTCAAEDKEMHRIGLPVIAEIANRMRHMPPSQQQSCRQALVDLLSSEAPSTRELLSLYWHGPAGDAGAVPQESLEAATCRGFLCGALEKELLGRRLDDLSEEALVPRVAADIDHVLYRLGFHVDGYPDAPPPSQRLQSTSPDALRGLLITALNQTHAALARSAKVPPHIP